MKICILRPTKEAYSETFIRAHIERLPAQVEVLYGGIYGDAFPTYRVEDDRDIRPLWMRGICSLIRSALPRNKVASRIERTALQRFLKHHKIDVALAEFGPTGVSVLEVCLATNLPLIVHFHGFDAYDKALLKQLGPAYRRMFAAAAAVIVVSKDMERQLLALGAPREKLFYNLYGVDSSLFVRANPALAQPIFVAVGRFVDKKAPHLTLLAFQKVVERCPEARLIMIGDGPLWEACKQLTKALGLAHAVELRGVRSHAEVAATMQKARAFVQHSVKASYGDSEGTPVVILEAGTAGLPVVSTKHAGIKDVVIHQKTGFLVDEGDIKGMAEYMVSLVQDANLAATMGQYARKHISGNFSMEKSIERLWKIIENTARR